MGEHKHRGFTLIELLVIVTLIAVLAALLLHSLKTARDRADTTLCQSSLRQMGAIAWTYAGDYGGALPPQYCINPGTNVHCYQDYPTYNPSLVMGYGYYLYYMGFFRHYMGGVGPLSDFGLNDRNRYPVDSIPNEFRMWCGGCSCGNLSWSTYRKTAIRNNLFLCPSAKGVFSNGNPLGPGGITYGCNYSDYSLNFALTGSGDTHLNPAVETLGQIRAPGKIMMMADIYGQIDAFGHAAVTWTGNGYTYGGCSWNAAPNLSMRHNSNKGGNVLFVDGRVEFLRTNDVTGLCPDANPGFRGYMMPF